MIALLEAREERAGTAVGLEVTAVEALVAAASTCAGRDSIGFQAVAELLRRGFPDALLIPPEALARYREALQRPRIRGFVGAAVLAVCVVGALAIASVEAVAPGLKTAWTLPDEELAQLTVRVWFDYPDEECGNSAGNYRLPVRPPPPWKRERPDRAQTAPAATKVYPLPPPVWAYPRAYFDRPASLLDRYR